jgi:hypothetical protein
MAGPRMAAPNQKALLANNNDRRSFGDIVNLVGALNSRCKYKKKMGLCRNLFDVIY